MSHSDRENSIAGGVPLRLYEFRRGTHYFRYTNADRDQQQLSVRWQSVAISDDGLSQSDNIDADAVKVSLPSDLPIVQIFRASPTSYQVGLRIYEMHEGETTMKVRWSGRVSGRTEPRRGTTTLIGSLLDASMGNVGLRLGWCRFCPYAVYDRNCTLSPAAFRVEATLASVVGVEIESGAFDALPDGWFTGGYVEWEILPGVMDRRHVESHVGAKLRLLEGTRGMTGAMTLDAFPGCDGTAQTCEEKFDNMPNYGGSDYMPGKSPYNGESPF